MSAYSGLIGRLVDGIATRLPCRTGIPTSACEDDKVLCSTRAALIDFSSVALNHVVESLLGLLEDLGRPCVEAVRHPSHVSQSRHLVIALIAHCFYSNWHTISRDDCPEGNSSLAPSLLGERLVTRLFDAIQQTIEPAADNYKAALQGLLPGLADRGTFKTWPEEKPSVGSETFLGKSTDMADHIPEIDAHIETLIEFVTATSWSYSFAYAKNIIHSICASSIVDSISETHLSSQVPQQQALFVSRILPSFWVNGPKLGLIIQEICSSYLHLQKDCQNAVAIAVPLLITRWIERFPDELIRLHVLHQRLEGSADTLFDVIQTGIDNNRKRDSLYTLQFALLLLLPDVFEVASNMKEMKNGSTVKKASFLDSLRTAMRNGNDRAGYCLVTLLRIARHFDRNGETALIVYALDIQDEVRDAIFGDSCSVFLETHLDQGAVTGAFISLAYLNMRRGVDTLLANCIAAGPRKKVELAVVQACCYFAKRDPPVEWKALLDAAIPFMGSRFEEKYLSATKYQGNAQQCSSSDLICAILLFLRTYPGPLLDEMSSISVDRGFLRPFLHCVFASNSSVRRVAIEVTHSLILGERKDYLPFNTDSRTLRQNIRAEIWTQSSKIVRELCGLIGIQSQAADIRALREILAARLTLLGALPGLSNSPWDCRDWLHASAELEATLLVSLCSANVDVCQTAISCFRLLLEEHSLLGANNTRSEPTILISRNQGVYRELASPTFRFTGLTAFQKRLHKLLRRMHFPTFGILKAWDVAFQRWSQLAGDLLSTKHVVNHQMLAEWKCLSGFLASLGGSCISAQANCLEASTPSDLRWIDQHSSEDAEEPLLTHFLRVCMQLLGRSNLKVREAMRDILSSETSPALCNALFNALERELGVLQTGASPPAEKEQESEVVFVEQAASLLKALVEQMEDTSGVGGLSFTHVGAMTLNLTKFIDSVSDVTNTVRAKIRICNLCEALTKRKELIALRNDVHTRNQLLQYISGWVALPSYLLANDRVLVSSRKDDHRLVQKNLDKACLQCLAHVTFRLPLQATGNQTDTGMSARKAQMFHRYFNGFLSVLHCETLDSTKSEDTTCMGGRTDPGLDSVITILSNLLSANIDVGLKHSLNFGYHENVQIRTAFVKVLHNVLTQGIELGNLSDPAVGEKYDQLLDVLTGDLSLPISMSVICPTSEVDELSVCLITIFEQRGLIFDLFEALIEQEIRQTENEAEILRRTCVVTKMLSVYAKWKGQSYLRATLQKVLHRLMLTSHDLDLELDPARVSSQEELEKNAVQLQIVAKVFMDDICASSPNVPASFRRICSIISEAVSSRFPNAKYTAVGAFVFLRFFCPAIVSPESERLVSTAPTKEMRRGLLLIAKIIQSLANNVLFGIKEAYMFPLNSFLVENIHLVTGFLRDISVPPDRLETRGDTTFLDFGSCVSIHRFLHDHWAQIYQNLALQGKKPYIPSTADATRGIPLVFESLQNLVTRLGPPPFAISWNRPHIPSNPPPLYTRFQNFMLRNASKGCESFLTSRAVYDGGESKDGLSIVCIILRHIEDERIDYDTLLYCYLKIASRLWQEPFGLFIDATCYKGRTEPADNFFSTLDLLTTSELAASLSRIYIYNMNSAFKRCFRRLLRISTRNENSVFHPKHVDYHLIGSLQNLQTHFHLSQLHLPKETISVVTDTRYVFQPVTRLSKSKGMVEVVVKVGSQFVQITTATKQEILLGLRLNSIVNDIFRLAEVEESANTIYAEDESAFGLRIDGGKIVMCFTSTKRNDVLQSIRMAKMKCGKEGRAHKPLERLVRPQDIPGTMLNVALANLAGPDRILRLASYNLMGALCRAFDFRVGAKLICTEDISVPRDSTRFIISLSKELACTESQLTSDVLTEFLVSWDGLPGGQKPLCLEYMAPWLSGLRTDVLMSETDGDKGRERVASLLHKLVNLVILDQSLAHPLEHHVWPSIARDEVLLEIFLDELVRISLKVGPHDENIATISSVIIGIGTVCVRGKVISRLRKTLNRSSLRPTRFLQDNAVWSEIYILLQFCLALSFDSGTQAQMFLPEVFHIATMLTSTGSQDVHILTHKLLVNTLHAACSSFILDDEKLYKLRAGFDLLCQSRTDNMSGASKRDGSLFFAPQDSASALAVTENLAAILFEACSAAAPSIDIRNAWRSRWMSLVASTAFQNNPAIQPKALVVLGYLAHDELDDDLLYQILVALRSSVCIFGEEGNSEMLVAIVTSLSRMMSKLPSTSRYGVQLFWLAMSLIRLVPHGLFNCVGRFLEAVLAHIRSTEIIRGGHLITRLMQSRIQLEEAVGPLDDAYDVQFKVQNFHLAACACLVRGLTDTATRQTALRVLSSFFALANGARTEQTTGQTAASVEGYPYRALILARCPGFEASAISCSPSAGVSSGETSNVNSSLEISEVTGIGDLDLLLLSAVELVDFHLLEDKVQAHSLRWMHKLALERPGVFTNLCGVMPSILEGVLLHRGQESAALAAAHELLHVTTSSGRYAAAMESTQSMRDALKAAGLYGIWNHLLKSFVQNTKQECFELTIKLIELIIV
ncbi:hypothetical protein CDD83_544 [Cordyceps sp. RAO-2017]|nr:hypothetical protein CDD83_544 [Cordyceps sp. RAO-2017]